MSKGCLYIGNFAQLKTTDGLLLGSSPNTLQKSNEVSEDRMWHTVEGASSHHHEVLQLSESMQTSSDIVLGDFMVCFLLSQQTEPIRHGLSI